MDSVRTALNLQKSKRLALEHVRAIREYRLNPSRTALFDAYKKAEQAMEADPLARALIDAADEYDKQCRERGRVLLHTFLGKVVGYLASSIVSDELLSQKSIESEEWSNLVQVLDKVADEKLRREIQNALVLLLRTGLKELMDQDLGPNPTFEI